MIKAAVALVLLSIFHMASAWCTESQNAKILHIGVSSTSGFKEINRNDVTAALKAWATTVVKEQGIDEQFDVLMLYGSLEELRAALKEHRLDGITLSVEDFMQLDFKVKDVFILVTDLDPRVRYAVIVQNQGGIARPEDLLAHNLVIAGGDRMDLAQPWLETLLADHTQAGKPPSVHQVKAENPSKAILQVFFRQADAALVIRKSFDLACELNPQLRRNLKVLAESPPFITSFFAFPPGSLSGASIEKLTQAIVNLHTTPGGRQVLTVFKSSQMVRYPASILDDTIQFLKNYHRLANRPSLSEARP